MATSKTETPKRAVRADVQRNRAKLLEAARAAFTESGADASLEDIARRAGVGIGTLYRHFPTRQHLIEATYVDEVEAMAREATELAVTLEPWDALVAWMRRFLGYAVTKRALMDALVREDSGSDVLQSCRVALTEAGEPLVRRAQESGDVRDDASFIDLGRMAGGIAVVRAEPEEIQRVLDLALDGLRYRPA